MRDRLEALAWEDIRQRIFITRAQYDTFIKAWRLKPINGPDGSLRFIWMQKGAEVHFIRVSDGPINPRAWLKLAEDCIAAFGGIACKIEKSNSAVIRFVERIGGAKTGDDEYDVHYWIGSIPHAKHFHSAA